MSLRGYFGIRGVNGSQFTVIKRKSNRAESYNRICNQKNISSYPAISSFWNLRCIDICNTIFASFTKQKTNHCRPAHSIIKSTNTLLFSFIEYTYTYIETLIRKFIDLKTKETILIFSLIFGLFLD